MTGLFAMKKLRDLAEQYSLEVAVFVCGALVMIFEINGSRIVAPFLGTSTYIWTSLIGVILGSLSVGYWIGGRVADKRPNISTLASVIFLSGGLVSVSTFTKDIVLGSISTASLGLEIKSLIAALLLFAPPSIAFGFVLPFATKIRLERLSESGKTVGRLYALSTIGSILGTFLAGFFLIPFVGSVRTLYLIAAALFALSIFLAPLGIRRSTIVCLTFFVFAMSVNELLAVYGWQTKRLIDIDTEYARLAVFDARDPRTQKPIRVIVNDPYFVQSAIFHDSDDLVFEYNRFFHLASYFKPDMSRALMIGGAGYSFPRDFLRAYPNATIEVVEIDPEMTSIARNEFRLTDDPRMRIIHADARVYLNNGGNGNYDVIFMDAFGTLFSIPYQLTTVEAVRRMYEALSENGVVIANIGGALTDDGSKFFAAEVATFRAVFESVRIYKVIANRPDSDLQNLILVGVKGNAVTEERTADSQISTLLSNEFKSEVNKLPVLTDDLAPVEYYNSIAQNFRRSVNGN